MSGPGGPEWPDHPPDRLQKAKAQATAEEDGSGTLRPQEG